MLSHWRYIVLCLLLFLHPALTTHIHDPLSILAMAITAEEALKHPLLPSNLAYLRSQSDYRIDTGPHGEQMQKLGFWTWGLLIYRCDYSDDDLWERYMAKLRDSLTTAHKEEMMEHTLHYLEWTVIEDEALDGASKALVLEKFTEWRDGWSSEQDGIYADSQIKRWIPRFRYAIHVGKDSLDSLRVFEAASVRYELPYVLMAVVHAPWPLLPAIQAITDDEEEEEEDGIDETWMYAPLIYLPDMYPEMVQSQSRYWSARFRPPPGLAGM